MKGESIDQYNIYIYLPVSQSLPVYPFAQVQTYEFSWSVQVPPFLHGRLAQSSISGMKITDTVIT